MAEKQKTELLHKLLDERGVKWRTESYPKALLPSEQLSDTYWQAGNAEWRFTERPDGRTYLSLIGIWLDCTPEQAIAATLGGNENRISERLRGVASDMRNIGASSMTPRELFAYWAGEVDKAADLADFMCGVNQNGLNETMGTEINGDTSDGYHTFDELYHHRAVLFSVIVRDHRELAWKARKHHDGTMYEGMFIVGIETPKGQASYHYDLDPYWDMFDCEELEFAPEWDGHTPDDTIARIAELRSRTCKNLSEMNVDGVAGYHFICSECGLSVCASMGIGEIELSGPRSFHWKVDGKYEFERCPRCGKAVKR